MGGALLEIRLGPGQSAAVSLIWAIPHGEVIPLKDAPQHAQVLCLSAFWGKTGQLVSWEIPTFNGGPLGVQARCTCGTPRSIPPPPRTLSKPFTFENLRVTNWWRQGEVTGRHQPQDHAKTARVGE